VGQRSVERKGRNPKRIEFVESRSSGRADFNYMYRRAAIYIR